MLTMILSGGQTGVDQAGLRAARAVGLATGGWAAKGWLVETPDGRGEEAAPWLKDYGLAECPAPGYPARRKRNVRHSDATILLGRADSHGSKGAIADCLKASKPLFHVRAGETRPSQAADWIASHKVKILNVAGNRESSDPGIGARAERFLTAVFRLATAPAPPANAPMEAAPGADPPREPKLTQQMTVHLNGGSEFSELRYDIYADGQPTGIRRTRRTNGSPKYLLTQDVFFKGDDHFDVLATNGVGLKEWVLAHLTPPGVHS